MTDQRTTTSISSFVTPTTDDIALFKSLPPEEQLALLRAEIDKGVASGVSKKTIDEVLAEARAEVRARNG